jgi:hypothetical protein
LKRLLTLICACWLSISAFAATDFFPLRDVRAGLKGVGKTVFEGSQIGEFQVEILGVLENSAPKQSIILARLTGGPLAQVGILQGMSGSPVYINGKLVGAVALGFPFSKEAIAGIQPIEQMLQSGTPIVSASAKPMPYGNWAASWKRRFAPEALSARDIEKPELQNISTPLGLGGITEAAIQAFAAPLRRMGFEPREGIGSGAPTTSRYTGKVEPGSMISVQLMAGDLNVSADGTVTYIDGKKVYAFGHRFLATGSTDLPFARAEVLTLLPSLNASFKISAARELVGSITNDGSTAISGEIGRPAHLIPLHLEIRTKTGTHQYNINLVSDRLFTPFFTQMALYSALDATGRTAGASTLRASGQIDFGGNTPALKENNVFAADTNAALQATFNLVTPLSFLLQSGLPELTPKRISFTFDATEQKRQLDVQDVWLSQHEARPGETVEITCLLAGESGLEVKKTAQFLVPMGAPAGRLYFTVSDASLLNFSELAGLSPVSARSAPELINILNHIRPNDKAYVRVWRQEPSFSLPGSDLTDPPPSVAVVLSKASSSLGIGSTLALSQGAQVSELPITVGDYAVTGSKTVQLEIKE